ncbi:hypothetical protein EVAR_2850_1 [Eumeta japonica]|uniref:Uncharacterized protein n=1 Tax=Eumeta variegata TaxID=151549 RepID=A0A4C1T3K5_EUMVA|nr:hypothetical protein EVAR_2850_1 [Eumeta japonica]
MVLATRKSLSQRAEGTVCGSGGRPATCPAHKGIHYGFVYLLGRSDSTSEMIGNPDYYWDAAQGGRRNSYKFNARESRTAIAVKERIVIDP